MKLLLLGASGMIGSRILAEALRRGHQVTAGARRADRIAAGPGVTPVALDAADAAAVTAAAAGMGAILLSVSPRSSGEPMTEAAAYGRAAVAAAGASGARIVVVGGAGTLDLPDGTPLLPHLPEMYRAEAASLKAVRDMLKASGTDWTYVSPSAEIAPGARTGVYRTGVGVLLSDATGRSHISAEDYAAGFMDEVETRAHPRETITIGY